MAVSDHGHVDDRRRGERPGIPVGYIEFDGEGHGFRQADNIVRAIEAELWFYGRILGFDPADEIEPVATDGRH